MGSIYQSIELLSKEKGIETQIVLDAVKDALLVVARKHYRTNENYIAELNQKTGAIDLFAVKKVVEAVENPATELTLLEARRFDPAAELESEVRIPKSTDLLGRISAQTAKQVIFQKIRDGRAMAAAAARRCERAGLSREPGVPLVPALRAAHVLSRTATSVTPGLRRPRPSVSSPTPRL